MKNSTVTPRKVKLLGCKAQSAALYLLQSQELIKADYLEGGFFRFCSPDYKAGLMDRYGRVILEPNWDSIRVSSEAGVIFAHRNKRVILFDLEGEPLLKALSLEEQLKLSPGIIVRDTDDKPISLDAVGKFVNGLMTGSLKDVSYIVTAKGKTVIRSTPKVQIDHFYNGLARCRRKNGLFKPDTYGYINREGKTVIPARYRNATAFTGAIACTETKQGRCFIDTQGNPVEIWYEYHGKRVVIPAPIVHSEFVNGYAVVMIPEKSKSVTLDGFPMSIPEEPGGFKILHESGKLTTVKYYSDIRPTGADGIYAFNTGEKNSEAYLFGLMDVNGKEILPPVYESIRFTANRRFLLEKNGKFGLADTDGHFILQPEWDEVRHLNAETVQFRKGSDWGIMDDCGNIAIPLGKARRYILFSGVVMADKGQKICLQNLAGEPALEENVEIMDALDFGLLLVRLDGQLYLLDYGFQPKN